MHRPTRFWRVQFRALRGSGRFSVGAGARAAAPFLAPLSPLAAFFLRCAPDRLDRESASGPISRHGWQAHGALNEIAYFQYVESILTTAPECRTALAAAKIVDLPLKRTELSKSHEIPRVRGDHSDPQAGGAHCNQRIIR